MNENICVENNKISLIVPIYKVETVLSYCVESLLNQTYSNVEIILVDDGSPDSCPQMCDEYAKKDSRIRVIHKENGGLSDARNAGLEIATGAFVSFVDSDDYISEDMVEKMYNKAVQTQADIVVCGYVKELYRNGIQTRSIPVYHSFGERVLEKEEFLNEVVESLIFGDSSKTAGIISVCNKMYSIDFLRKNSLQFEYRCFREDWFFHLEAYQYPEKVAFVPEALYHYRSETSRKTLSGNYNPNMFDLVLKNDRIYKNNYPQFDYNGLRYAKNIHDACVDAQFHVMMACSDRKEKKKKLNEIREHQIYKKSIGDIEGSMFLDKIELSKRYINLKAKRFAKRVLGGVLR